MELSSLEIIFISLFIVKWVVQMVLDALNRKEVLKHAGQIPSEFADLMDAETYQKSVRYTLTKNRFSMIEMTFDLVVIVAVLAAGVLPYLYDTFTGVLGTGIWGQAAVLILVSMVLGAISIPFELWNTFKIEAEFGFNKSTLGLWLGDKVKGLLIGLLIGLPLLALLLKVFDWFPVYWWLIGFFIIFSFQLIMFIVYPIWIMPLFNKFEELPEGELRNDLMELSDRTGFRAKTILVMDGSKRSGHSNAFFTGFGSFRRIVLFDTLMEQLKEDELAGVLAHEIGHYKCGHIPKMLMVSALSMLIGLGVLGYLSSVDWFFSSFGFSMEQGMVPALLLFSILSGPITFWIQPFTGLFSRKHEYEADEFAFRAQNDEKPLIGALHKLHEKNLSNLTPHPLYSKFYYSHPSLKERENALRRLGAEQA